MRMGVVKKPDWDLKVPKSRKSGGKTMKTIYFTITGMNYYYGTDVVKKGSKVELIKEPDNKYDKEAILVKVDGLGAIGHVANSVNTVLGESYSAGRIYDRFKKRAKGKVVVVTERGAVCELKVEK